MQCDRAIDKLKEDNYAGIIRLRIAITQAKNERLHKILKRKLDKPKSTPCDIMVSIYLCRDLPAADEDGSSDVRVKSIYGNDQDQTVVISDNCNPV